MIPRRYTAGVIPADGVAPVTVPARRPGRPDGRRDEGDGERYDALRDEVDHGPAQGPLGHRVDRVRRVVDDGRGRAAAVPGVRRDVQGTGHPGLERELRSAPTTLPCAIE
ncbi:hypothetical protein K7472_10925 [Streptomyces sp. PTM05]|uniref:Uncharacterized protein n=1 Tax=Streptantibioticus parmotrematis TaxID=2873249 RepID=A0ABS7QU78_9ACTN|nr:hypothetical protein [Streptantibioticus parmotrematis]MBY8885359.1 hypothetical protein [Streptantibioticus parmotrematis]